MTQNIYENADQLQYKSTFKSFQELEMECLLQMQENGIPFQGPLNTNGEIHRFSIDSKKHQPDEWYVAHQGMHQNGNPYLCCTYGTWSEGQHKHCYRSYKSENWISQEELNYLWNEEKRKQKEIEEKIKKDKEERIVQAKKAWDRAQTISQSKIHTAYLELKKIKNYGGRYSFDYLGNPVLVLPLRTIKNEVQAVQYIKEDGEKRIHGIKRSNFHLIGEISKDKPIHIAEGYATAASIHEALDMPVVVAFDCGNIDSVLAALKSEYPKHQIIIAADDDRETNRNPGKTKAEEAAKKYGCDVVLPKFPNKFTLPNGDLPSDFNDLHVNFGLEEVKNQLTKKKARLSIIDIKEFLALKLPPRKLILNPWLPEQGLAMIYAKRGIGKTHIALSVGYAIACGGKVLKWEAPEPRRVLYVDGEMPAATIQERLFKIAQASDKQPFDSSFFKLITPDLQDAGIRDLSTYEGQSDINQYLKDFDVLILDNLSTLIRSGNENEAESWVAVQEWVLALRKAGKSVIFIHHAGKGGQQRGTSKKEDVLDTVITLKQPKDSSPQDGAKFEVHFEKSRGFDGEAAKPFETSLGTNAEGKQEWALREISDRDLDKTLELHKDGLSVTEIAKEIGVNKSTISRWLKKAKQE